MYQPNFNSFEYCPYELKFRFSQKTICGILLKFHFTEGEGYSCFQSWADPQIKNLPRVLEKIQNRNFDQKLIRSLHYAYLDVTTPIHSADIPVYYSAPNIDFDWQIVSNEMKRLGLTKVKTKLVDIKQIPQLLEALTLLQQYNFKFILDFKSKFEHHELKTIFQCLKPFESMITYIEDPTSNDFIEINTSIPIASDEKMLHPENIRVWKPMRSPPPGRVDVVTSLLDHPIGQLAAIREAKNVSRGYPHGVATHLCFEGWETKAPFPIHEGKLSITSDHHEILQASLSREKWRTL